MEGYWCEARKSELFDCLLFSLVTVALTVSCDVDEETYSCLLCQGRNNLHSWGPVEHENHRSDTCYYRAAAWLLPTVSVSLPDLNRLV